MGQYRKKPVVIEAIQWNGDNYEDIKNFGGRDASMETNSRLTIKTLEGEYIASINDYIIKGVQGEVYPCKPDIFKATYEEVKETNYVSNMDFGQAIQALKDGKKVSRVGWNGNGMWLTLFSSLSIGQETDNGIIFDFDDEKIGEDQFSHWKHYEANNFIEKGQVRSNGETTHKLKDCICMFTAAKEIQLGWLASQADILAEDWGIV